MLADKLRIAQHGLPNASRNRAAALAERFSGTVRISRRLIDAIAAGDALGSERIARELNEYVRAQVVAHFSVDLAHQVTLPTPQRRTESRQGHGQIVKLRSATA
jgi:hypothetical protein